MLFTLTSTTHIADLHQLKQTVMHTSHFKTLNILLILILFAFYFRTETSLSHPIILKYDLSRKVRN